MEEALEMHQCSEEKVGTFIPSGKKTQCNLLGFPPYPQYPFPTSDCKQAETVEVQDFLNYQLLWVCLAQMKRWVEDGIWNPGEGKGKMIWTYKVHFWMTGKIVTLPSLLLGSVNCLGGSGMWVVGLEQRLVRVGAVGSSCLSQLPP